MGTKIVNGVSWLVDDSTGKIVGYRYVVGGKDTNYESFAFGDDLSIGGDLAVTGTLSASGVTSVTDTTDATSTTAASLKTAGGLAVAKKAYFGDAITATAVIPLALRRDLQISAVDQSFGLTSYSARYDASNYGIGAYISAVSGSAWSVSNYESYLAFQVTPSASTTPAEALRLSSTALTLATGVQLNLGATGQIKFPATQNASADANTLDDYEEGTWTPAYSTTGGSFTYDTNTGGTYTKVGRLVTVQGSIQTVTATVGTGAVLVTGLPFTAGNAGVASRNGVGIGYVQTFAGDYPSEGIVFEGTTQIQLYYRATSNGASIALDGTDLTAGAGNQIMFSATYFV